MFLIPIKINPGFCGVDAIDLCLNDEWIDSLTIDVSSLTIKSTMTCKL